MNKSGKQATADGCIGCFLILVPILGLAWLAFPIALVVGGTKVDSAPWSVFTSAFWTGGYDFALGWAGWFKHVLFVFWVIGFFVFGLYADRSRREEAAKKERRKAKLLAREIARELRRKDTDSDG